MIVELEITTNCMLRCAHCYISEKALSRRSTVFDNIEFGESLLRAIALIGARTVVFTGGEPTAHRHFQEYLRFASELSLRTQVYTNGFLGERFWSKEVAENTPTLLQVSMYGFSERSYRLFTGSPKAFDRAKSFLIAAAKFPTTLQVVFPKVSMLEMEAEKAYKWANTLGAQFNLYVPTVQPRSYDPTTIPSAKPPNHEEAPALIESRLSKLSCGAGLDSFRITAAGEIRACHLSSSGIFIDDPERLSDSVDYLRQQVKCTVLNGFKPCGLEL